MFSELQKVGAVQEGCAGKRTTYHIEVKGTVCGCDEPFHLSQKQMNLVSNTIVFNCEDVLMLGMAGTEVQSEGRRCPY